MSTNPHLPTSHATNAYDLLSDVVNLILDEPLRYNQGTWLLSEAAGSIKAGAVNVPMCKTIGCVAGWTATLKNKVPAYFDGREHASQRRLERNAQELLGLTEHQEHELFEGSAVGMIAEHLAEYSYKHGGETPKRQTLEYAILGAIHIRQFQTKWESQLRAKAV